MRVSNQMTHRMLTDSIMKNQAAVYRKEEQISSGKRIQRASDDPAAWARINQLRGRQAELEQYGRNAQLAESRLLAADQALDQMGELLRQASAIAVQASDGTLAGPGRAALAADVDALLEQFVAVANRPSDEGYLFGGVSSAAEPFEATRNAAGQIGSVAYTGAAASAPVEIAAGEAVPAQLAGDGVVSGDAFAALAEMRDRLQAGENLAESGLQPRVDAAFEETLVARAAVGANLEHLSFAESLRINRQAALAEDLSATEGVDMAQAVTELSEKQTAYEAALAMASKTINTSLLNYI